MIHERLKQKCDNLMTLIHSNLTLHSNDDQETIRFTRLNIPLFLTSYVEDCVSRLMKKKEALLWDPSHSNQVHLYIDPFKMCYLIWPFTINQQEHYTITLGPLINQHITREEIHYMGLKMKLSSDSCFILESFYSNVPYYDTMQLVRIASVFLDYMSVESHIPQIIREDHSILFPEEIRSIESKFEQYDFVEKNYQIEGILLQAIEQGDVDAIHHLITNISTSYSIPPRFASDPLREQKNLAVTLNSLCQRAALKGGLDQSIAHNLSHQFAIQIEHQSSVDGILDLTKKIIQTYTLSVHKYALQSQSRLVNSTITYIRSHLTEKITLIHIANHLHVSHEYLCRHFKQQMHMTLTDYIHKTKTEESCSLLTSNKYSISDIAYTFGYSSPAHYSKMFKKFLGMSPRQWHS
jgi:two-component system, response regulator YesN